MKVNMEKYIVRKFENETILLDVERGTSHILDDVATLMFECFEKYEKDSVSLDNLFDFFHDTDYSVIEKDYHDFIRKLIEMEIIIHD